MKNAAWRVWWYNNKNMSHEKISKSKTVSFDDRIVDFKAIHNQKPEDFERFIDIIDAQPGQVILDGMDGYGAAAKEIIQNAGKKGFSPEIYTLDESTTQVENARKNIPNIQPDHIIQSDIRNTPFSSEMFDTVVIKMGLHEIPKLDQVVAIKEVYRILKNGGKFVTWDLSFHDSETQKVFQDLIRKKDQIAGFDSLVENRYFSRQEELISALNVAGFKNVLIAHEVDARLSMRVRESELVSKDRKALMDKNGVITTEEENMLAELGKRRCGELISFAKEYMASISDEVKKRMQYEETEDDIKIVPNKEILVGYK